MSQEETAIWDKEARAQIEDALKDSIGQGTLTPKLRDALHYAIFPGGKRIRPMLTLALCSDLGGNPANILAAAISLEILHCASLIHDDLPALDNDDMRRGRASCHRALGEATALLAGDVAVSFALELALELKLESQHRLQVGREIARAYTALCNGQQLDVLSPPERGATIDLYRQKTGALFGAAFAAGAIGAGKSADFIAESRECGVNLGVLFQLHDDAIDGAPEKGRAESSDSKNKKVTAILTEARSDLATLRNHTILGLESLERKSAPLQRVRSLIGVYL